MENFEDKSKIISAIYRAIYKNGEGGIHRNVLKKQVIANQKVASKSNITPILEGLIALGKLKLDGEMISINSQFQQVGILSEENGKFFIICSNSNRHLPVDKSIAAGYKVGDMLDIVTDYNGKTQTATLLGKSSKVLRKENQKQEKNQTNDHSLANSLSDDCLLGRVVKKSHDELVFIPNKKSIETRQIKILNNTEELSKFQDKICIMRLESKVNPFFGGTIIEVKGEAGNTIQEYDAIAESYGAIMSWTGDAIENEISQIPTSVDSSKLDLISEKDAKFAQVGKIVDLRNLDFVTVDPATCKDMDDAIYSSIDENGDIVSWTAVANVSKYVDLDSLIGNRYINGGFTIYAPNKAYNILPTELSTGICSLNPGVDRQALVIKTIIDRKTGEAKSSKIYDALIQSRKKYSYEEAQSIVDDKKDEFSRDYLEQKIIFGEKLSLDEQTLMNYYAAETIKAGFLNRKMIRFNSNNERDIKFDEDFNNVIDIKTVPHLLYHEVIEAFMITANEATAKYTKDKKLDSIYRVHDEPNRQKNMKASEFFKTLGITFDSGLSAQSTLDLINTVKGSDYEETVNNFLIKMQTRAVYSDQLYNDKSQQDDYFNLDNQISHYALQSKHYSHTTSPIRRVVDYVVHYNILADIHAQKPLSKNKVSHIIEIANQRQLDIDQAEKDFDDISSVLYCEKHIGEKFSGLITKFRYSSSDDEYDRDKIIVIVKNKEKGISAEIPLSKIIGNKAFSCSISEQSCMVLDNNGKIVLSLCRPLDFIVEKADRKTMNIIGKTDKILAHEENNSHYYENSNGFVNKKYNRMKRFNYNKSHHKSKEENMFEME